MRPRLILLVLLAACTRPWSLDDRPCPCATGLWGGADVQAMEPVDRSDGGRFSSLAP